MLGVINLFNDAIQQSCLGVPLHEDFLSNLGAPALLTVPLGEERAFDWSSNSNHGTLNGGITTVPGGFGTLGAAWNGNGTSSYINVASITGLPTGSAARTMFAVVNLRAIASGNNSSYITQVPVSGQGFTFQTALISGSTYCFTDGLNGSNNVTISGAQIPTLNAWHMVAFVFDGAMGYKYYLDGQLAKSGSFGVAINTNSNDLKLMGRVETGNKGYLDGLQGVTGIFSSALSATQISTLCNCLFTGEPFPLFQPQASEMMMATAVAAGSKVPWPLFFGRAA